VKRKLWVAERAHGEKCLAQSMTVWSSTFRRLEWTRRRPRPHRLKTELRTFPGTSPRKFGVRSIPGRSNVRSPIAFNRIRRPGLLNIAVADDGHAPPAVGYGLQPALRVGGKERGRTDSGFGYANARRLFLRNAQSRLQASAPVWSPAFRRFGHPTAQSGPKRKLLEWALTFAFGSISISKIAKP
jgi:hypothetical protein